LDGGNAPAHARRGPEITIESFGISRRDRSTRLALAVHRPAPPDMRANNSQGEFRRPGEGSCSLGRRSRANERCN